MSDEEQVWHDLLRAVYAIVNALERRCGKRPTTSQLRRAWRRGQWSDGYVQRQVEQGTTCTDNESVLE